MTQRDAPLSCSPDKRAELRGKRLPAKALRRRGKPRLEREPTRDMEACRPCDPVCWATGTGHRPTAESMKLALRSSEAIARSHRSWRRHASSLVTLVLAMLAFASLVVASPAEAGLQGASCASLNEFVRVNNGMNAIDSKMLLARTRFGLNPATSRPAWITAENNSLQTYDRLHSRSLRLLRRADVRSDSTLGAAAAILNEQLGLRLEGGAILIRVLTKPSSGPSLDARFKAISARVNVLVARFNGLKPRVNTAVARC